MMQRTQDSLLFRGVARPRSARTGILLRAMTALMIMMGVAAGPLQAQNSGQKKFAPISVLPFVPPREYWLPGRQWVQDGNGIAEKVESRLFKEGIPVVERAYLQSLTQENILSIYQAGDVSSIGAISAARYMLIGHIEDLDHKQVTILGIRRTEFKVKLAARLVDVRTSRLVQTFEGIEGKDDKTGLALSTDLEKMFSGGGLEKNPFRKALENAADKLAKEVRKAYPEMKPGEETEGLVGRPQPVKWIIETGGEGRSREAARKDALVNALKRAVAKYLDRASREREAEWLQKNVYDYADRFAVIEGEPISEGEEGGTFKMLLKVGVYLTDPKEGNRKDLPSKLKEVVPDTKLSGIVMVIIPEHHIQRPIPDPAVETAVQRKMLEAGFELVDANRIKQIRYSQWVQEMAKGNVTPETIQRLKDEYGVDFVVTGEAFSERANADRLTGALVTCGARGEIKIIRMADGRLVHSDSIPQTVGQGTSESISAKAALEKAGEALAPKVVQNLLTYVSDTTVVDADKNKVAAKSIKLVISGWESFSETSKFVKALKELKGVERVTSRFEAPILTVEIRATQETIEELPGWLEEHPSLKTFGIKIKKADGVTIEGSKE